MWCIQLNYYFWPIVIFYLSLGQIMFPVPTAWNIIRICWANETKSKHISALVSTLGRKHRSVFENHQQTNRHKAAAALETVVTKIKVYPQSYSKWTVGFNSSAASSLKVEKNSRKRLFGDNGRRIHRHQQLSMCLRTVSDNLEIQEDFFGFYKLNDIKSDSIMHAIKDVLLRSNLSLQRCQG